MPKEFTDIQKKYIKESLEMRLNAAFKRINVLNDELSQLTNEVNEVQSVLKDIDSPDSPTTQTSHNFQPEMNGYPKEKSWSKKAAYVIIKSGRSMTTGEVADQISKIYEPEYKRKEIVPKLSVSLTTTKIFDKKQRKNGEYEYFLK